MTSIIDWHSPAQQLPDDGLEVIVAFEDGETTGAYLDGTEWRYICGATIRRHVVAWADFPEFSGIPAPPHFLDVLDNLPREIPADPAPRLAVGN